jgi:hypothetical protein
MKLSKNKQKYILFTATLLIFSFICMNTTYKLLLELKKDYLDFKSTTKIRRLITPEESNKVCKKATSSVKEYFEKGEPVPEIENFNTNSSHIQAILKFLETKDEPIEIAKKYIPRAFFILLFLVLGVFTLIFWPFCWCCCLCNCKCCCCCKGKCCQFISFLFACISLGSVIFLCTIQVAITDKIFVNLSTTSCAIFKLVTEAVSGQPEEMAKPKWEGIVGVNAILANMSNAVNEAKQKADSKFNSVKQNLDTLVEGWPQQLKNANDAAQMQNFEYEDSCIDGTVHTGIFPGYLDYYGPYTKDSTTLKYANEQFMEVTKEAKQSVDDAAQNMDKALTGDVTTQLNDAQTQMDDLNEKFNDISEKFLDEFYQIEEEIDKYGKKYVKVFYSVIMGMCAILLALIILNWLLCKCLGCFLRIFIHILWNIMYLLCFITFILAFLLGILGIAGKDGSIIAHYLISETNLESEKPLLINDNDTINYINTCVNGNGELKEVFNFGDAMNSLDELYRIRNEIAYYKTQVLTNRTLYAFTVFSEMNYGTKFLPMNYFTKNHDDEKTDFDKIMNDYLEINKYTKSGFTSSYQTNPFEYDDYWYFSQSNKDGYTYSKRVTPIQDVHDYVNKKKLLFSLYEDWTEIDMNSLYRTPVPDISYPKSFLEGVKSCIRTFDAIKTRTKTIFENIQDINDDVNVAYEDVLKELDKALGIANEVIDPLYDVLNSYLGEDSSIYDILNCKFIGNNIKVLLKEMNSGFGKNFYTFGLIMGVSSILMIIGIYSTILTISIGNRNKKEETTKNEKPQIK